MGYAVYTQFLTLRQGVSLLTRRTWSLPQTDQHLLNHVE